jgi:hypothetical protein
MNWSTKQLLAKLLQYGLSTCGFKFQKQDSEPLVIWVDSNLGLGFRVWGFCFFGSIFYFS